MIKVSIVVNDYHQMQGINSVVDQFFINKDAFLKNGIQIEYIYDFKNKYTEIPVRASDYGKNKAIELSKKSSISKTFFYKVLAEFKNILIYQKMSYNNLKKSVSDEDILLFQDKYSAYEYLKKEHNSNAKIIFMTHIFDDCMSQVLMSSPCVRGTFLETYGRKMYETAVKKSDYVVTICNHALNATKEHRNDNKTCCIYNSVNVPFVLTNPGSHGVINIVMASSITKRKGIDLLLDALKIVKPEYSNKFFIQVYGFGEYFPTSEEICKKEGFKNIKFYGSVQNPYLNYLDADALMLTSRDETLPMSILEAMQLGLPVLATDVGAVNEMITDKENGILMQPTPESIAKGIETLVKNKHRLKEWGERSKEIFDKKFSNKVWAKSFCDLFYDVYSK